MNATPYAVRQRPPARGEKDKLRVLARRLTFILGRLATRSSRDHWLRAEAGALAWALRLLAESPDDLALVHQAQEQLAVPVAVPTGGAL